MEEIKLSLTPQEVDLILQVIGRLPTSSGAFPLLLKIKTQADAILAKTETKNLNDTMTSNP